MARTFNLVESIDCTHGDSEPSTLVFYVKKEKNMEAVVALILSQQCYHVYQTASFICVILSKSGLAESMGRSLLRVGRYLQSHCSINAVWEFGNTFERLAVDQPADRLLSRLKTYARLPPAKPTLLVVKKGNADELVGYACKPDLRMIVSFDKLDIWRQDVYGTHLCSKLMAMEKSSPMWLSVAKGFLNILGRHHVQSHGGQLARVLYMVGTEMEKTLDEFERGFKQPAAKRDANGVSVPTEPRGWGDDGVTSDPAEPAQSGAAASTVYDQTLSFDYGAMDQPSCPLEPYFRQGAIGRRDVVSGRATRPLRMLSPAELNTGQLEADIASTK